MNEQRDYGVGKFNSRRWQDIYREQMRGFQEYLQLQEEFNSHLQLSPCKLSRLETLIEEMRNSYFLPEKWKFYLSLSSKYQAIYQRMFLNIWSLTLFAAQERHGHDGNGK